MSNLVSATPQHIGFESTVSLVLSAERCLLANGRSAQRAVSCLLHLLPGDVVLVSEGGSGELFVLHVLQRLPQAAVLSVPYAPALTVQQTEVNVEASDVLVLRSLRDAELSAATGTLSVSADNLFMTVRDSLVEQANHLVSKLGHCLVEVRHLWRQHAQDVLVTAERDVKVDAERISMG